MGPPGNERLAASHLDHLKHQTRRAVSRFIHVERDNARREAEVSWNTPAVQGYTIHTA